MFNNRVQKDKENYLYAKGEIKEKVNRLLNDYKNDFKRMREFIFEKTGYWDIFTFEDKEVEKAFCATLIEYEKGLVKINLEQFKKYDWYDYILENY